MKKTLLAALLALLFALSGCGGVKDQSAFTWQISLVKSEVRDALHTTEGVKQYEGDVLNVTHDDAPGDGNSFVILTLQIEKTRPGGGSFDWARLSLRDKSGAAYARMENDGFLASHGYQRLPGTPLQIGENTGSICFELPVSAAKGALTLEYDAGDEGINRVSIQ